LIRVLGLVLGMLCLANCSGVPSKHDMYTNDYAAFKRGEKGAVLLNVKRIHRRALFSTRVSNLQYDLRKLNDPREIIIENNYYRHPLSFNEDYPYARKMLFLEPGLYYLDAIYLGMEGSNFETLPAPGYAHNMIKYGAFEVQAGKVIALGSLIVDKTFMTTIRFMREDGIIKNELREKGYPEIAEQMEPGQFYESGSILMQKENGAVQVLPKEVAASFMKNVRAQTIERMNKGKEAAAQ
jgi:hypothetical protein